MKNNFIQITEIDCSLEITEIRNAEIRVEMAREILCKRSRIYYARDRWEEDAVCKISGRFCVNTWCARSRNVYLNERNFGCNSPIRTNFAVGFLCTRGGLPPSSLPLWNYILPVWCSTAWKSSGLYVVNRVTARLKGSMG